MKSSSPIKQLQCLNNVLALATGSDPYFSEQIERALRFQGRNHPVSFKDGYSIEKPAETLLQVHLQDKSTVPFHHWHLDSCESGLLWISAHIKEIVNGFKGQTAALLLVTGLRTYVCPNGKRWSHKSQKQYKELLALIQKDTAKFAPLETHLHLICI